MMCEDCHNKEANFHYTEIINDQTKEIHLCQECAAKKKFFNSNFGAFNNDSFNTSKKNNEQPSKNKNSYSLKSEFLKCETCGLLYTEFRKRGKLGCADCYKFFGEELNYLLTRIHNSNKHIGKRSKLGQTDINKIDEIKKLKLALDKAIQSEEYEKAIQLRDDLKKITQKS